MLSVKIKVKNREIELKGLKILIDGKDSAKDAHEIGYTTGGTIIQLNKDSSKDTSNYMNVKENTAFCEACLIELQKQVSVFHNNLETKDIVKAINELSYDEIKTKLQSDGQILKY